MVNIFRNRLVILTLIAVTSFIIVFTYLDSHTERAIPSPRDWSQDTETYIEAIEYLKNTITHGVSDAPIEPITATRLLTTPLMLLSSLGIGTLVDNYGHGMLFVNLIFYLFSVLVFYRIVMLVYENTKVAFIATMLYITNWLLFSFGTTYLADMGGWFFLLLTTLCSIQYYKNNSDKKWIYFAVASSIVGVFFKEYGALGMISLTLLIAISEMPIRRKVSEIILAGSAFTLALVLYHISFYFLFHYTYFNWYEYNYDVYVVSEGANRLMLLVKVIGWVFLSGWPLFLLGLYYEWKNRRIPEERKRWYVLLALLPASAMFLIWPAFTQRVAFILIPWVAMIAGYGLSHVSSRLLIGLILVGYVLVNYHTHILMLKINMPF